MAVDAPSVRVATSIVNGSTVFSVRKDGSPNVAAGGSYQYAGVNAIQAVWRGDMYVHPAMTRALLKDLVDTVGEFSQAARALDKVLASPHHGSLLEHAHLGPALEPGGGRDVRL